MLTNQPVVIFFENLALLAYLFPLVGDFFLKISILFYDSQYELLPYYLREQNNRHIALACFA